MKRLLIIIFSVSIHILSAQNKKPPFWLTESLPDGGRFCEFVVATGEGTSLDAARQSCRENLLHDKLNISRTIKVNTKLETSSVSSGNKEIFSEKFTSLIEEDGNISVRYKAIDEHLNSSNGLYRIMTLYAIDNVQDNYSYKVCVTKDYKSSPYIGLSVLPGAAQMYKGSYLKGSLIIGGTVCLAIGTGVAEYQKRRAAVAMSQTHNTSHKYQYARIADNMTITRNICIGALAGVYLYNILDAVLASGKTRIAVIPYSDGKQISLSGSIRF